tara:strand:+ start:842 stop:1531 length:690 start_codon:yes stop_codon:yes gene_type:complete
MVSIDRVYQKVLALANKEQRGYITPQEFNLFADHAQTTIFDQYFYDLEQFKRRPDSNIDDLLDQKIQIFKNTPLQYANGDSLPDAKETHQIENVYWQENSPGTRMRGVQRIEKGELAAIKSSPLLSSSVTPSYYISNNKIYFTKTISGGVFYANIIRKPSKPNWTYLISGGNALYNHNNIHLQNFELHSSEENNLVVKILQLAGITIKDFNLTQAAAQEEVKNIQQEKQ